MIVRRESDSLVLITQADHAALSEIIMSAWRVGNLQVHPRRQIVLVANREHDNGWHEFDRSPTIDTEIGHPHYFTKAPDEIKQRAWPSGVARLETSDPEAAALVAQHALTVLAPQSSINWRHFFKTLRVKRDRLLTTLAFDGRTVTLTVKAHRIPIRRYTSDIDLRQTFDTAPCVFIRGHARGHVE